MLFRSHSLSTLSVFSLLHSGLLASLSSTQRVLISGKDDESPRKSGVAGAVGSGTSSMVFNVDTTGWSGRIHITAPVERTTIRLAAADAHDTGHSPGAFPFVSATFMSFLLPICPNDLSHFAFAFVHSLHVHLASSGIVFPIISSSSTLNLPLLYFNPVIAHPD